MQYTVSLPRSARHYTSIGVSETRLEGHEGAGRQSRKATNSIGTLTTLRGRLINKDVPVKDNIISSEADTIAQ